jgi:calcium/proton exchanger cax
VKHVLTEIRRNPLLWLLAFVPAVFIVESRAPDAATLKFVLSVLAIVPLAAFLSHATESVAAKTGDAVGGLLNATLGNLTELVIAVTALRAVGGVEALTGILMCGWSTGFFFAVVIRLFDFLRREFDSGGAR